ncbi:hypothetical protein V5799_005931, partial [Amblyomma americanum]
GQLGCTAVTQALKYLTRVLDETLRMFPPVVTFTTRSAANDIEYDGLKYQAGTNFLSPTIQVHMDPRIWPEPEKFNPDRFLPENVAARPTIAYQPFGGGPRNSVWHSSKTSTQVKGWWKSSSSLWESLKRVV